MTPRRNLFETHYHRLEQLLGCPLEGLRPGDYFKLRAPGFMDLTVEVLSPCRETGATILSLAHYFEQNGDLCQDPEMTVRLFAPGARVVPETVPSTDASRGQAEALTFQQAVPPIYRRVYPEPGKYSLRLRHELNDFLALWLRNLEDQGHRVVEQRRADTD